MCRRARARSDPGGRPTRPRGRYARGYAVASKPEQTQKETLPYKMGRWETDMVQMKIGVTHLFKNEFAEAESVFLTGIDAQPSTDPCAHT